MSRWATDLEFDHLTDDAVLEFDHLTDDAVREAKRYLLDSLGCALGGYQQHDVKIALEVLEEHGGTGPGRPRCSTR
jgi:2-methylcitrate dehydratase PrpD